MTGRLLNALRAAVLELIAPLHFYALFRYRVINVRADGRMDLQAVRKGGPAPDLIAISQACGIPGGSGKPTPGAVVLVSFADGDPGLPVVTHFARPEDGVFVPAIARLDAKELVEIGASADMVELGSGTDTPASGFNGRLVRYGDIIATGSGPLTIAPATPGVNPICKVKA